MKQYIGISRDHSGSMKSLRYAAKNDYNDTIESIKKAAAKEDIDTVVSVVRVENEVEREKVNSSLTSLKPIESYSTPGESTKLFDSVMELVKILESVPDASDKDVSFLVMAITDGDENASKTTGEQLSRKIKSLQATDKWTFVFRVPHGYKRNLARFGIPEGNIQEWEQTERGMNESTIHTQSAFSNYYANRNKGIRSTTSFYTDLKGVSNKQVQGVMTNISSEVRIFPVKNSEDGDQIRSFVQDHIKRPMQLGSAFYQLTKPEKEVQDYKLIVIRDKKNGSVFAGQSARDLLNLPTSGTIRLSPGDHGNYDIYIQSTSVNRKLVGGTNVLYWENAGRGAIYANKK